MQVGELPLLLELSGLDLEQFGLLPGQLLLVVNLPLDRTDLLGLLAERQKGTKTAVTTAKTARAAVATAVSCVAKMSDMGEA